MQRTNLEGLTESTKDTLHSACTHFLQRQRVTFWALFLLGLGDYVLQNMHHTVFFGRNIIVGVVLVIMLAIPCYWISRVNNVDNV